MGFGHACNTCKRIVGDDVRGCGRNDCPSKPYDPRKFVEGPLRAFLSGPRCLPITGPKVRLRRQPVPACRAGDVVLIGEHQHEIARVLGARSFELKSGAIITLAG
jgi:hypothetical protein